MKPETHLSSRLQVVGNDRGAEQQTKTAIQLGAASPAATLSERAPWLGRHRTIILSGLLLFLLWAIVTRGLAAYLAETAPEAALWLRSTEPTALTRLADLRLNPEPKSEADESPGQSIPKPTNTTSAKSEDANAPDQQSPGWSFFGSSSPAKEDLDQVKAWAELAVRNDPLNARALRVLGQLALRDSDVTRANALMLAAARRSMHESFAVYWTMLKHYREGDYPATLRCADILLRTRHQLQPYVMPILAKLAETPASSDALTKLLVKNPPWRPQFFANLPANVADARTPLAIFLSLKDSPTPPTSSDLRSYLELLVQRDLHELAYYAWLQFLSPEQMSDLGRLFNGNFAMAPSGLPFDWTFKTGNGVTLQIAERPDQLGDNGLLMEFGPGRVDTFNVRQMIMLPAGNYLFQGKHKVDLMSQRGIKWQISCAGTGATIGESPAISGTGSSWKDVEFSFTVPESNCLSQYVSLGLDARSASEQFISGSLWCDGLQIVPQPIESPVTQQ